MNCVSRDSYQSASHHKCKVVPGALTSKFTILEKPNIWCWLCDANFKMYLFGVLLSLVFISAGNCSEMYVDMLLELRKCR